MIFPRSSGILLHPTSLPGRFGIGDLGEWAYKFADFLEASGQSIWQVLPLGPTGYGDSPYQCLSAFAGNPNLISLDTLVEDGFLTAEDLADVPDFEIYYVDFGPVIDYHNQKLHLAYQRFQEKASNQQRQEFEQWSGKNAHWLDDFSVFMALKLHHGGKPWPEWPDEERDRRPAAIERVRQELADEIKEQRFKQWLFSRQWANLRRYANTKGICFLGDIPIFVAHDSSDVWANRDLFYLDDLGNPTVIAGVPPDYFSATGQRWGNPLYRWGVLKANGYDWWIKRFQAIFELVDIARVDHFRGFDAYWEVPASEETAINGQWVPGPGMDFLQTVKDRLGSLAIVAEDLGVITPEVEALRDGMGLPGMRILQFAFGGGSFGVNAFLPHNHIQNCVVYTGTHDNNTTLGWWLSGEASEEDKQRFQDYIGHSVQEIHWDMIRLGMSSVANTFILPLQDLWGFGEDTRMNLPGRPSGNWGWRFTGEWLNNPAKDRLAHMTRIFARWPEKPAE
jgi:4-alpha-glucanotransferase